MKTAYRQFIQQFPKTEINKLLAPLNTFHIGGPADLYYKLTNLNELPDIIDTAQKFRIKFFILGGGSNTIFADKGLRGLIIHMHAKKIALENGNGLHQIKIDSKSVPGHAYSVHNSQSIAHLKLSAPLISAEAGALLSQVIQFALQHQLTGMEKMMGLPGTIGGAVRGNAGAFGTATKDIFAKALIYTPKKGLHEVGPDYFKFAYRFSTIKKSQEIILKVYLKLKNDPLSARQTLAEAMDILKNRISKQPKGYCSGSFFKNPETKQKSTSVKSQLRNGSKILPCPPSPPPPLTAGYLLEKAGCKGLQVGQIKVSAQHANWLMNLGKGTQKDLIRLCRMLQKRVKEQFHVSLEREVQLVDGTGHLFSG